MNPATQQGTSLRKRVILWFTFIGVVTFVLFFMRRMAANGEVNNTDQTTPQEQTTPVIVRSPQTEKVQATVEVTGSLRANQRVTLTPKISERVAQILVEEGDTVKSGQLLITLADAQLQAQVAQAEAALNSAKARLEQTKASKTIQDVQIHTRLEQAQADLAAAQVRLEQAETQNQLTSVATDSSVVKAEHDLQVAQTGLLQAETQRASAKVELDNAQERHHRRERLYHRGVISEEELTEAKRALDVSEAQAKVADQNVAAAQVRVQQAEVALKLAKSNTDQRLISQGEIQSAQERKRQAVAALHAAEVGTDQTIITAEDIKVAAAAVEQAEANLTYIREQLGNTEIHAPFGGVITRRMVNLGQTVAPASPLVELVALDTVYMEALVSETEIAAVQPGMPVRVTVDSLPGQELEGRVSVVIPVSEQESRTFRIRIHLPQNADLRPGSFGRVRIITREAPNALIIPKSAVVRKDEQDAVFVVSDGQAKLRQVTLGVSTPDGVEVKSGLAATDQVVTIGAQTLQDGAPVMVTASGHDE